MKVALAVVSGLMALVATASRGAAQQAPADGAALYARQCAGCHGAAGVPNPAMVRSLGAIPDFTDARGVTAQPDSVLQAVVAAGKGRNMPTYRSRLTAEQIRVVVSYVKTLSRRPSQ